MSATLESLHYTRGSLEVLDQLLLPLQKTFIPVSNIGDAWSVIRTMQVRGAPLIAIVAALGLAVDVYHKKSTFATPAEVTSFLTESMTYLRTSRPTAVNLFVATDALQAWVNKESSSAGATIASIVDGFIEQAEVMLQEDVATNKAIGDHGAARILQITGKTKVRVLTICNTGSLATAGYGTALGVVRSLHAMGALEHVYACETRPYNQGARLTAFEIVEDGLPGTLVCDSMASALMAVKGVDCVVVGADRVAANGDTANKIGTYQLAITAKYHNVPFFSAVPTTTLDLTMSSGALIHVEERPANELTEMFGRRIAPEGIAVWNPSFDVTPCSLIRGVITEVGVAEAAVDAGSDGVIDMPAFLTSHGRASRCEGAAAPCAAPNGYQKMNEVLVSTYVAGFPALRRILGMPPAEEGGGIEGLTVAEVGDGNLNFVYIVSWEGGGGGGGGGEKLIVKQALPYVRCVGESWPLTLQRAKFEVDALREHRRLADGEYVPEVYHFDPKHSLIVMKYIAPPHIILRKAFMQKLRFSSFAAHLATYMSKTLFGSSLLAMEGGDFRNKVSQWSQNTAMCALTEKVIFTDPYTVCSNNHWTTPHLDTFAEAIRTDSALKLAALNMKTRFVTHTEALLHADLHSGSVMAMEGSTFVIDPEFAFYGPIGFDLAALISNILLSYFSQAAFGAEGAAYADWLLEQLVAFYEAFSTQFVALWNQGSGVAGEVSGKLVLDAANGQLALYQQAFMSRVWIDTLGFCGAKMIRRIVGIAHVADLESIEDFDVRAACEKRALRVGRLLVLAGGGDAGGAKVGNVRELVSLVKSYFSADVQTLA